MKSVGISIKTLYQEKGEQLDYCRIKHTPEAGEDYYDLVDSSGIILCMDGEECEVISTNDSSVELRNVDSDMYFKLSKIEFGFAHFE